MNQSVIWKKLVIQGRRFATSNDIKVLSKDLNKNYDDIVHYLQKCGYIQRIFKGIFYIKTPNEIKLGRLDLTPYEIISEALKIKGIKNWYFGLETALKLNNMTHEYFMIDYIISDQYRTTKAINIFDRTFKFIKWTNKITSFGIIESQKRIRYSDKEKTILDIAYREKLQKSEYEAISIISEYLETIDKIKMKKYLEHYPKGLKTLLQEYV